MGKKSKRNSGPKPGGARQEKLAARRAEREALDSAVATRPFEGLAFECDLVALREFVPSATAPLPLREPGDRAVTLASVLPGAVAALVRDGGEHADATGFVGMQVQQFSGDLGADLAASVQWVLAAEPGDTLAGASVSGETPAVTELLAESPLDITVHQDFAWWLPEGTDPAPDVAAAIEQANAAILPSARIDAEGVDAAWWVDAGEKAHLRWVRPEDEDELMLALARLHAAGGLTLGEGSRFAGSFRTHGLVVPVFDLDREQHPAEWADATAALGARIGEALASDAPLTADERRARDGIRGRQVTLR
ncbi:hypothetical protein DW322_03975 [Rhodococcus rhodnii]|uniref:DUF5926 domain-containing protein n=2 Tax=Rhodococcus rhodnii TaxID=38312 RepID=R7WSS2_9NOCA|nr:DUF5926 family protein [Rhodococcus rhodnii]EOM78310.1 hypothetical protein Rrhod_0320 [Rhodococcus rhodnii LMG 5362]TXG89536.1 hypothetical protein DW322_03975 [Rhodococcus rhodnii]